MLQIADIWEKTVYPIKIIYHGVSYLTLYYYTENEDGVLHDDRIICFSTVHDMEQFCEKHDLKMESEVFDYDFDKPITNPIDYRLALDNWNLLDTIAKIFGMYFEGRNEKYTQLYNLLFCLNTPVEPIPSTYRLSTRHEGYIHRIFRKKERYLKRFKMYAP